MFYSNLAIITKFISKSARILPKRC
ncbi:hypothetical protein [Anaerotignum sp.]